MSPLAGFPHSVILGSRLVCSSPRLIAAYHDLHRLSMPRHPPCALLRLISNSIASSQCPRVGARRPVLIPHTRSRPCGRDHHPSFSCQRASTRSQPAPPGAGSGSVKRKVNVSKPARSAGDFRDSFRRVRRPGLLEISRKEVIQPQVPLRLPCYDFAPVTELTFDGCLLAVSPPASGPPSFHGVTGGVYKARERIHRGVADPRLLAIPASCSRVADYNPNLDRLLAIGAPSRVGDALYRPL